MVSELLDSHEQHRSPIPVSSSPPMAQTDSPSSTSSQPAMITNSLTQTTLIAFNSTQLPVKLTPFNFPSWKAQFDALLFGYDLLGFVDGSNPCPPSTINTDGTETPNPKFVTWQRQDKLLFHGILSSLSDKVIPVINSAKTSAEAWSRLTKNYANASSSHIMGLTGYLILEPHIMLPQTSPTSQLINHMKDLMTLSSVTVLVFPSPIRATLLLSPYLDPFHYSMSYAYLQSNRI
ncbi:hypothetical protein Dimus_039340 [Dionaea muscipula]